MHLSIEGMTCGGCVRHVERALRKVPGVTAVSVELSAGAAQVTTSDPSGAQALLDAVERAGYHARLTSEP